MDIFKQVLCLQQVPSAGIVGYLTLFSSLCVSFFLTYPQNSRSYNYSTANHEGDCRSWARIWFDVIK